MQVRWVAGGALVARGPGRRVGAEVGQVAVEGVADR